MIVILKFVLKQDLYIGPRVSISIYEYTSIIGLDKVYILAQDIDSMSNFVPRYQMHISIEVYDRFDISDIAILLKNIDITPIPTYKYR